MSKMDSKSLVLSVAIVVLFSLFSWVVIKDRFANDVTNITSSVNENSDNFHNVFKLRRIDVIHGHEYDLTLVDGSRIRAYLTVRSTPEAKDRVVHFLNNTTNPKVVLIERSKNNGNWYVDLLLVEGENEISISKWLSANNLVYRI